MLQQVVVKNFRRLEDRTFDFTKGLNVIRGFNEQGKSTLFEAIAYALFGAKALRSPLAEVVTWGKPESTLKVTLLLLIEGVLYTITRSKAGAEVTWGADERTVGQNEVSAFMARVLGTSISNANNLVLSGQGDVRGALESGPKATTELIEQLSNFSILDEIITLIGERLVTGSETTAAQRLELAAQQAEIAEREMADVPKVDIQQIDAATHMANHERLKAEAAAVQAEVLPVGVEVDRLVGVESQRSTLTSRAAVAQTDVDKGEAAIAALSRPEALPEGELDRLRKEKADHTAAFSRYLVKYEVDKLAAAYPEQFWDKPAATLQVEIDSTDQQLSTQKEVAHSAEVGIAMAKVLLIVESACGLCGKDLREVPEVAAKNAAAQAQIDRQQKTLQEANAQIHELTETLKALRAVQASAKKYNDLANRYPDLIELQDTAVPPVLVWKGGEAPAGSSVELDNAINKLEMQQRDITRYETEVKTHQTYVEQARTKLATANASLALLEKTDNLAELKVKRDSLNSKYGELLVAAEEERKAADVIKASIDAAVLAHKVAEQRLKSAREGMEAAEKDLAALKFNNDLLKSVRAARPAIANKLWEMVLSAVSRYFSEMRGTPSIVTKDSDGFKVDGKRVENLSGSTLDILGLAIRYALVRTFLPLAPFIVLDEPSAACDDVRTQAMLSFVLTGGFSQTLLVTHENMSETVADNLVTV